MGRIESESFGLFCPCFGDEPARPEGCTIKVPDQALIAVPLPTTFQRYSTFASPWAEWGYRSLGREIAAQLGSGLR